MKSGWAYVAATLVMAICTGVGTLLLPVLSVTDIAMLYLVAVGLVSSRTGRAPSVFAAVLSVAAFDFFFVPPRFTFAVSDLHYVVTFAVMFGCALVIRWLAERIRLDAVAQRELHQGTAALYPMTGELLAAADVDQAARVIARHVRLAFAADVATLLRAAGGRLTPPPGAPPGFALGDADRDLAERAFGTWQPVGLGTEDTPSARALFVPLVGANGRIGVLAVRPDDPQRLRDATTQWLLQTFAGQAALALERAVRRSAA
jgi:two-component system, OmpR family, sensor histidine kinase KdpD